MYRNDGRVMSNFILQALNNNPITIYGDGSKTRSFCYVDDLITGLIKVMDTDNSFTGPINLGSDKEISIKDLAEKIIKLTKSNSKLIFMNPLSDDPMQRRPDLTLAKKTIGWSYKTNLDDGIKSTVNYFKKMIKSYILNQK